MAKKPPSRKKRRGAKPPPLVISFLACDSIVSDASTGNHTIVSVFHDIVAPKYPAMHPRFSIFLELTNGHGKTPLEIRFIHEKSQITVFSIQGEASFSDPRQTVTLCFSIGNVILIREGEYRLQLFSGSVVPLIERRITAHMPPKVK